MNNSASAFSWVKSFRGMFRTAREDRSRAVSGKQELWRRRPVAPCA
jgi:hypothetical protein